MSVLSSGSVDAELGLKTAGLGVVAPEQLGDVVGLVVGAGGDAAADRGVRDVHSAILDFVVEHPGVGDLAGEGDAHTGAERVRIDRRAARREENRARASLEHPVETAVAAATAPRTLNSSGPRTSSTLVSRIGFMNSFAGSGEYSSTSMSPSSSASCRMAACSAAASRMSAAAGDAVRPSTRRSLTNWSSFSALREISPTARPSRPKRRATAWPRLGPAPMMTMDTGYRVELSMTKR